MFLQAQAATVYRINTLDVATVFMQATQYAGTETAIAIDNTYINRTQLVYIYPNRVENRNQFSPNETITLSYIPGPAATSRQTIEMRVIAIDSQETIVQNESDMTLQSQGYIDAQAPSGGWETGDYQIELWISGILAAETTTNIAENNQ